jgi:hypothetical protein
MAGLETPQWTVALQVALYIGAWNTIGEDVQMKLEDLWIFNFH